MSLRKALTAIEKHGALLVFPIHNKKEPLSLWSVFHPKSRMTWEWNDDGDNRVADLWHLRSELSSSGKVVYSKWYKGRATVFSKDVFTALLATLKTPTPSPLKPESKQIMELLLHDSPLSTKQIKRSTDLVGRAQEPLYQKAMKELWSQCLVVGYGEVDDGAFPSLAIGATQLLFEEQWIKAKEMNRPQAETFLRKKLGADSLFLKAALAH